MNQLEILQNEIRIGSFKLHRQIDEEGITSEMVLNKSRELDKKITEYYTLLKEVK